MKQFNLEEYLKNPSRKVVTRDGQSVKIHCTNFSFNGDQLIVAEIEGSGYSITFSKDGKYFKSEETPLDLFFAPEKHEGWVNIYRSIFMDTYAGTIFNSKEEAKRYAREDSLKEKSLNSYLTTVKIEWEE